MKKKISESAFIARISMFVFVNIFGFIFIFNFKFLISFLSSEQTHYARHTHAHIKWPFPFVRFFWISVVHLTRVCVCVCVPDIYLYWKKGQLSFSILDFLETKPMKKKFKNNFFSILVLFCFHHCTIESFVL